MKIRTDFVTNSSSSAFAAVLIEDDDLADLIREIAEDDASYFTITANCVGELEIDNDTVYVISEADSLLPSSISRKLKICNMDLYNYGDRRTQAQKEADARAVNKAESAINAIEFFLRRVSKEDHNRIVNAVTKAYNSDEIGFELWADETDGFDWRRPESLGRPICDTQKIANDITDKEKKSKEKACVSKSENSKITDAEGIAMMTMAQAETVWTVKTVKAGLSICRYVGNDETLIVPSYIEGKPVVTIDKGRKNTAVKRIIIPETVKKINTGAFPGYAKLAEIVFKSSETVIGAGAFSGCPLMFDDNNCFIANGVLQDCKQSEDILIRGSVKIIPDRFLQNSSIKKVSSISILDSVEEIGIGAFNECAELKTVSISDSVKQIWNGAFMRCVSLETVKIGDSVEEIHYVAFYGCNNLKSITLGRSLRIIDREAFSGCISLVSIHYNGTIAQWRSIKKGPNWNHGIGNVKLFCLDGIVEGL